MATYSEKYYLVKFHEDLCDEGYLVHTKVVEGKNMDAFMKQKFRVRFGNMEDDELRSVKDCASVTAITEEELNVLRRLGLTEIRSGHFGFCDDYDEDEEEYDY